MEAGMRVARGAIEAIVAHAREEAPAECCGLLLGPGSPKRRSREGGRDAAIVEAVRTRNIAGEPSRFLIDPHDHINGRRDARRRGLDVVGFYHSHPGSPAIPSETDRAEASYPDHVYLIVSLAGDPPDVALFRLDDDGRGNFLRLPFVTVR